VVGTGAMIAMWGGRSGSVAFLFSGVTHLLVWPPPPNLEHGLQALFLTVVAMVFLSIGEFVAVYLAMLATTTMAPAGPGSNQFANVQQLQRAVFGLLAEALDTLSKIKAMVGFSSQPLTRR
jgi:hypothetical protein